MWFPCRWSGELVFSITNWLYGREATCPIPAGQKTVTCLTGLGGGLLAYHLVGRPHRRYISIKYMQPWSAAYMTPYLILMVVYQKLGFWAWLWPVLYGLHAIGLMLGLPIRFGIELELLNIVAPIFGYGLIAILTGHLYSRYALWKLKSLTRGTIPGYDDEVPPDGADAGDDGNAMNG